MELDQLFEHQKTTLQFHLSHDNSLDLSEVGVGKTAPAILWLTSRFKEGIIKRVLILTPNSVTQNWANEIQAWSDLTSVILRGTKKKRLELLSTAYSVYIINFEGVRVIYEALAAKVFDAIIVDEAHHIKAWKGSK